MHTGVISYRVTDFLKQFPPFQFMEQADLLLLASRGRVRFHEADEHLIWQGAAHGSYIFVVQQGTVALLEEVEGKEVLRDVIGPGDIFGLDRLFGYPACRHSAKSQSEVVVYALPLQDFEFQVAKYPEAEHYLTAQKSVVTGYVHDDQQLEPHVARVLDLAPCADIPACLGSETLRDAAKLILRADSDVVGVVDAQKRIQGLVSARTILEAITLGSHQLDSSLDSIILSTPAIVGQASTVSDAVLKMAAERQTAIAVSEDGTVEGRVLRLTTAADMSEVFGDHPLLLLQDIDRAQNTAALRTLQHRLRKFILSQMSSFSASDWLSRLSFQASEGMLSRIARWNPPPEGSFCWCFYGAAGRSESLASTLPWSAIILENAANQSEFVKWSIEVQETLAQCGRLLVKPPFDTSFACAPVEVWEDRFRGWVHDPILTEMYEARPLFDMKPVLNDSPSGSSLWKHLESVVMESIGGNQNFLRLLAHDSLTNLPPLTFFRDVVIDEFGEMANVFQLERNALLPLVDVGRVFGFAANRSMTSSTIERMTLAGKMHQDRGDLFAEAADAFRVALSLQGRVAIRQNSAGVELAPSLLSHHDRQLLKSGFRSIGRLLEFARNYSWPEVA